LREAPVTDARKVIAIVEKNSLEEVRISLNRFRGHDLIDVRVFAAPRSGAGDRQPTKQGISLKIAALPALISAPVRAEVGAVQAGFLAEDVAGETEGDRL
jgi:hypothetical protein